MNKLFVVITMIVLMVETGFAQITSDSLRLLKGEQLEVATKILDKTFTTHDEECDSIVYKLFLKKNFAKNMQFKDWKIDFNRSEFIYTFTKKAIFEDVEGENIVTINLLSKKYTEQFSYCTVARKILVKDQNGVYCSKKNPNFDAKTHIKYVGIRQYALIPELLHAVMEWKIKNYGYFEKVKH